MSVIFDALRRGRRQPEAKTGGPTPARPPAGLGLKTTARAAPRSRILWFLLAALVATVLAAWAAL